MEREGRGGEGGQEEGIIYAHIARGIEAVMIVVMHYRGKG